jgi:hypothetical protein
MKRWAQLVELRHSLGRARAIAEELQLIHLANTLTHNLGVIQNEITQLDKLREAQTKPPEVKPPRASRKVASNPKLEGENSNVTTNQGETI